jgi:hypothetical protein
MRRDNVGMLSSRLAWQRLRDIQQVVANQPVIAHAVEGRFSEVNVVRRSVGHCPQSTKDCQLG